MAGVNLQSILETKAYKAELPAQLNPIAVLEYYERSDLLVLSGTPSGDVYFAINRQNLVRFFRSRQQMEWWLEKKHREPAAAEPEPSTPTTLRLVK